MKLILRDQLWVRVAQGGLPWRLSWRRTHPPRSMAESLQAKPCACKGKASFSLWYATCWAWGSDTSTIFGLWVNTPGQPWVENKFGGHWTTMSRMLFNCSITSPVPGDTGDMCHACTFVYRSSCVHSVPPRPRVQFLSRWCPCPSRITSLLHLLATCSHSPLLAPAGFVGGGPLIDGSTLPPVNKV